MTRTWSSYVAIGDSFSEGMSDPDPRVEGSYLGWADRLADALARRHEDAANGQGAGSSGDAPAIIRNGIAQVTTQRRNRRCQSDHNPAG